MVRLLLIRHAATDAANNKRLLGSTDAPATSVGLAEVARLAPLLAANPPEAWLSSPMRRAVQTLERLESLISIGNRVKFDKRLREIDFGRWEGRRFSEIAVSDPGLIPAWSKYSDFIFPEGEEVQGFIDRVQSMLDELRHGGSKVIGVVTHGGVIRTMICLALGLEARNYLLFAVQPASLTMLDLYPEGGVLSGLNL